MIFLYCLECAYQHAGTVTVLAVRFLRALALEHAEEFHHALYLDVGGDRQRIEPLEGGAVQISMVRTHATS